MIEISENRLKIIPKISLLNGIKISALISSYSLKFSNIIYLAKPSSDFEVLAVGKIISFESSYQELDFIYKKIVDKIELNDLSIKNNFPVFFGYVKFPSSIKENLWSDFSDSEWILPELVFYRNKSESLLIQFSLSDDSIVDSDLASNQSKEEAKRNSVRIKQVKPDLLVNWEKEVNSSLEMINKNRLQKIVLSRKKEFEIFGNVDFSEIFEKINNDYSDCFNFLIKSNDSFFFGSSPELLVQIDQTEFKSEALAGSIKRGRTEIEDNNLSQSLLMDNKNLNEHQIVIDYLESNLRGVINNFHISDTPKIKKLKNIQHLQTEIKGQLKEDCDVFNLISKIFPTPAVCGIPKDTAISELPNLENFERGIFTGLVGWFNFNSQADFYVAIRCGLIKENFLSVFAGCGIVNNSNAIDEYQETELKLKAITDLFDVED